MSKQTSWRTPRYFVMVVAGSERGLADILQTYTEPTRETHGERYSIAFGPERTYKDALNALYYQSYVPRKYIREG